MDTERTSSPPRLGRQDCLLPLKLPIPARIPLLYVILGVLLAISVLPMYFYSAQIENMNRERLKTNEMLLQKTVTRSLADDIAQHQEALPMMLASSPIMYEKRFLGMIGSVVDMDYLIRRLQQVSLTGLMPYVVDSQGRLVAAATAQYATGQDMGQFDIVRSFVGEGSKAQLAAKIGRAACRERV